MNPSILDAKTSLEAHLVPLQQVGPSGKHAELFWGASVTGTDQEHGRHNEKAYDELGVDMLVGKWLEISREGREIIKLDLQT